MFCCYVMHDQLQTDKFTVGYTLQSTSIVVKSGFDQMVLHILGSEVFELSISVLRHASVS